MSHSWWLIPGFLGDEAHFGEVPALLGKTTMVTLSEFFNDRDLQSAAYHLTMKVMASGERPHLVGYSLGGRLALHAALLAPGSFASITVISAHPGLRSPETKHARLAEDQHWAELLRTDWPDFWARWNQRGVLAHNPVPPIKTPSSAERQSWSESLINFSTAKQMFLPPFLQDCVVPLQAIVGVEDHAYVEHLQAYPENVKKSIVPQAGHRLPLEQPQALAQLLIEFAQENP